MKGAPGMSCMTFLVPEEYEENKFISSVAIFLFVHRIEALIKSHAEACFCELKMATTSGEFAIHGFDIWTYFSLLPSLLQRIKCT